MKQLKLLSRLISHLTAFHASDNYPLPQTSTRAGVELPEKSTIRFAPETLAPRPKSVRRLYKLPSIYFFN